MTTHCLAALAAKAFALALCACASRAQGVAGTPFAEVDINGDDYLDAVELMALFDGAGLNLLSQDRNGDGLLSRRELRASQAEARERGAKKEVSATDPPDAPSATPAADRTGRTRR